MSYQPTKKILKKYADLLVTFALNGGAGVKKEEVVFLQISESAKPMAEHLMLSVLEQGAYPIMHYFPENLERKFYENASMKQVKFFPKKTLLARVKEVDHFLVIISESDKHELEGVDSKKMVARRKACKFYIDARHKKEYAGKLTWTVGLFGTEAEAQEAGLTLKQYWDQIIKACYLDYRDPVKKWKALQKKMNNILKKLNSLDIDKLEIKGKDVDLTVKIGKKKKWIAGGGKNIPSFEIYISPDWRGTQGKVSFDQPLYRYGSLIKGIELEFKKGKVVKAKAKKNQKLLEEIKNVKNADRIGEFSLTDKRFSRITKFMAETLYDENIGGKFGNFHIALGLAFKDCYDGNFRTVKNEKLEKFGFNLDCVEHVDIMSTTDRTVTAVLSNGKRKVIYKNGMFVL